MFCMLPSLLVSPVRVFWILLTLSFGVPSLRAGEEVINMESPWRYHAAFRDQVLYAGADGEIATGNYGSRGEMISPVSGDWQAVEFDDQGWQLHQGPFFPGSRHPLGHGQGDALRLSHLQVRGMFHVENPRRVRELRLSARYRGGVVLWLNGEEVGRWHLGEGVLEEKTLAEAYDTHAASPYPRDEEGAVEAAERRLRGFEEIALPVDRLRRGANVLALQVVGAPLPKEADEKHTHMNGWSTAGLQLVRLSASPAGSVSSNVGLPEGIQVWTAPAVTDIGGAITRDGPAELADPVRPVRLVAARNYTVSAPVVLSSRDPIRGVRARLGAFSGEGGALSLPAGAARVRYATTGLEGMSYEMDRPDVLVERPVDGSRVQPVWVSVEVPKDAPAGTWRATLELEAEGMTQAVEVPVDLVIHGWDGPDPQEWRSMLSMVQSPHSVAWHYGVEMWSDAHLELLAPSLSMMRALGNNVMYVDVIHPSFFAPEHGVIVFREEGGQLKPDFTYFERYLDAYARHVGEPRRINLVMWEPYLENEGKVRVSVRGEDGSLHHREVPLYGEEGSREMWAEMMEGVRARVLERGWDERAVMLGVGHDRRPRESIVRFFNEVAPFARWMLFTHGRGDPNIRDGELTIGEMRVGLQEYPYEAGRAGGLNRGFFYGGVNDWYDAMTLYCGRMSLNDNSEPSQFRLFPSAHVVGRSAGFARQGVDKWPVVNPHRQDAGARRMVHGTGGWGNLYRHKVRALLAPGPEGALPTVRFEMMRQGLQDTEARIYLERALRDEAKRELLGDDVATAFHELNEAEWAWRRAYEGYVPGTDWAERQERLYALAARAQESLREAGLEAAP